MFFYHISFLLQGGMAQFQPASFLALGCVSGGDGATTCQRHRIGRMLNSPCKPTTLILKGARIKATHELTCVKPKPLNLKPSAVASQGRSLEEVAETAEPAASCTIGLGN